MTFLNKPIKSLEVNVKSVLGVDAMPWYNPQSFPILPSLPFPTPVMRDFKWRITLDVNKQVHSSYLTTRPGLFDGFDITVGLWIANTSSGQAWQITEVEEKTPFSAILIIEDVFRYNTFLDTTGTGTGAPNTGIFVIFELAGDGFPKIDPAPFTGISSSFTQNLTSRFRYVNPQNNFALFQANNSFTVGDLISVDANTRKFVVTSTPNVSTIGRVTSISDTIPGWFTVDPMQEVVDYLDYLPGDIGDFIYRSTTNPGQLTLVGTGTPMYVKLRNQTPTISYSKKSGPTQRGNIFKLNGIDIVVNGFGLPNDIITAVNLKSNSTKVISQAYRHTTARTTISDLSAQYGEIIMYTAESPPSAKINNVNVVFTTTSNTPGYVNYSEIEQIVSDINQAGIPNIEASMLTQHIIELKNTSGGSISITDQVPDKNGILFAGPGSATGLPLYTAQSTDVKVKFIASDSRAIEFVDVIGRTIDDFGLISTENGVKAAGLSVYDRFDNGGGGTEPQPSTGIIMVANLSELYSIMPATGTVAYVADSADESGNHAGEWSTWIYTGDEWTITSTQDAAITNSGTISATITPSSWPIVPVGKISSTQRISLMTVTVTEEFDPTASALIRYTITQPDGTVESNELMSSNLMDLSSIGKYTATTDILFGQDTISGEVVIEVVFDRGASQQGSARITISYI